MTESVLVGRREELAAFQRALVEVEGGRARVLALRGEPGIGKSRLLAELAGRATRATSCAGCSPCCRRRRRSSASTRR